MSVSQCDTRSATTVTTHDSTDGGFAGESLSVESLRRDTFVKGRCFLNGGKDSLIVPLMPVGVFIDLVAMVTVCWCDCENVTC